MLLESGYEDLGGRGLLLGFTHLPQFHHPEPANGWRHSLAGAPEQLNHLHRDRHVLWRHGEHREELPGVGVGDRCCGPAALNFGGKRVPVQHTQTHSSIQNNFQPAATARPARTKMGSCSRQGAFSFSKLRGAPKLPPTILDPTPPPAPPPSSPAKMEDRSSSSMETTSVSQLLSEGVPAARLGARLGV